MENEEKQIKDITKQTDKRCDKKTDALCKQNLVDVLDNILIQCPGVNTSLKDISDKLCDLLQIGSNKRDRTTTLSQVKKYLQMKEYTVDKQMLIDYKLNHEKL